MNALRKTILKKAIFVSVMTLSAIVADASVIPVGEGAFPGTSTPITFAGLANGTEVNGLSSGGILFNYSLGNGMVQIDGGPGVTNNLNPPNVVSIGNPSGVLTLTLPGLFNTFGFGYALEAFTAVPNATTINLFNGTTNVGTLSYTGVPDPTFAGGFAGIQSTVPFNRVEISFNSAAAPAFALDNIRLASGASPACPIGLCITNYTLVSEQAAGGGRVYATYRADLVNTLPPGVPVLPPGTSSVTATLINLDPFKVRAVPGQDHLNFAAVLNNNSVTHSSNTFTVIIDPNVPFDPNQLQWTFQIGPVPLIANPGPNQTVPAGSAVTVNGSGSSNPGGIGGPLTYSWMFISRPPGSTAVLFYETTPTAMFVANVPGTYVLKLTVTNGSSSSTSIVTITAQ